MPRVGNAATDHPDALRRQQRPSHDSYDGDDNLTLSVDADNHSTSYQYDPAGEQTLAIQGYGGDNPSTTSMFYDAAGNETLQVIGAHSGAAESTSYAYDANGNQTQTISGYKGSKPETTVSQYDGDNNLTQQTDPDGYVSSFTYDSLGNQTLAVLGFNTGQPVATRDAYDGDGNLTLSVDGDGNSSSYLYDSDGNQTLSIQGLNGSAPSSTSMRYDADGNETLVVDGDGYSSSYEYDSDANVTLQISGLGSSHQEAVTSYYDLDNNLTEQIDGDNHTSDYSYDSLGNQTQVVLGVGSGNANTTTNSYDGDGNLTLSVNAVNASTSYAYDAEGNQTLEIDGLGTLSAATTQYKYDAAGNQTQEIDPDGNTTDFQYDADGEQTTMTQAVGALNATTSYQYDDDSNLTLQTNPNGTSVSMSYDAEGNLTSGTWYASTGSVTNSQNYTYDGDGNIRTASNDAGAYTFGYNADGEETQAITPSGTTLNYQYDADGNTTEITDFLGDTVTSQYDAEGDLTEESATGPDAAQVQVTLGYDGDGNMTGITRKGQVSGQLQTVGSSSYAYDAQGDVTSIVHNAGSTTLASYDYSYNAAAQLTQEIDNATTTAYSYDAAGQLTAAGSTDYKYDANGNPDDSGYSIGPNNELLSDGTWDYSYDANDNLIKEAGVSGGPDAGDTWTFAYDPANEMTSAVEVNGQGQSLVNDGYEYDVFGHLYQSSVSTNGGTAVVTHFVYNDDALWLTLTSTDNTLYGSTDQPNQYLFQMDASNGVYWLLDDHLNSVRAAETNSGQLPYTFSYDAYGNESNATSQIILGFTGAIYQQTTGLNYEDIRWYKPQTQQWMQQDPTLLATGSNDKEYVEDSPTNFTDPTGQDPNPTISLSDLGLDAKTQALYLRWLDSAGKGELEYFQRELEGAPANRDQRIEFAKQVIRRRAARQETLEVKELQSATKSIDVLLRSNRLIKDVSAPVAKQYEENLRKDLDYYKSLLQREKVSPTTITAVASKVSQYLRLSQLGPYQQQVEIYRNYLMSREGGGEVKAYDAERKRRQREPFSQEQTEEYNEAVARNEYAFIYEKMGGKPDKPQAEMRAAPGSLERAAADRQERLEHYDQMRREGASFWAIAWETLKLDPWVNTAFLPGGQAEQMLMALSGFAGGVPMPGSAKPESAKRARISPAEQEARDAMNPNNQGSNNRPIGNFDTNPAPKAPAMKFEIPINEGGSVNIIGRQGATEIELIGNMSRVGDTIRLEGAHFTKNAGGRLTYSELMEFAREFGRQQGAKEVVIQGAMRTTGKSAGQIPKPITVKVD